MRSLDREQIEIAFVESGRNIVATAKRLGVGRTLLYYYIRKTGADIRIQRTAEQIAAMRERLSERRHTTVIDCGKGNVRSDAVSVAIRVAGTWYAWRISRLMSGDTEPVT